MSLYNEVFAAEYRYQRESLDAHMSDAIKRGHEAAERVEPILAAASQSVPRERPDLDGIAGALYTAGQEATADEVEAAGEAVLARLPWNEANEPVRRIWRRIAEAAFVVLTPGE